LISSRRLTPGLLTSLLLFALAIAFSQEHAGDSSQTIAENSTDTKKYSVLEGVVVKEPGSEPLKKTIINMIGDDREKSSNYTATTDAAGRFRMEKIEPGRYTVLLEKTGYVSVNAKRHASSSMLLTVQAGKDITDLVFRMLPMAVISGRVVDEDGDPMAGVHLSALHNSYTFGHRTLQVQASAATDDLGQYRLSGLPPGRYIISATPTANYQRLGMKDASDTPEKSDLAYVTTYYPNTPDKSQAVAVEVHPGDEVPVSFNLVKTNTFHLRGKVVNIPATHTDNGVVVLSSNETESLFNAAAVEKDGKFELPGVAPGSYTVVFRRLDEQNTEVAKTNVVVTNADVNSLVLAPAPPSRIQGRAYVEDGRKLNANEVWVALKSSDDPDGQLSQWSEQENYSPVSKDGTFEMKNVIPGAYEVEVTFALGKDFFAKKVMAGGKDLTESSLRVNGGATIALDVVLASDGAEVDGTVLDSQDKPLSNVTVVAVPDAEHRKSPSRFIHVSSDQQGHFLMRAIPPGDYTIIAWEEIEDGAYSDPEVLKKDESSGKQLHLAASSRQTITLKAVPAAEEHQP
jgi:hypothetical protein